MPQPRIEQAVQQSQCFEQDIGAERGRCVAGIVEGRPYGVAVVKFCCHCPDNVLDRRWGFGEIDGMAVESAEATLYAAGS